MIMITSMAWLKSTVFENIFYPPMALFSPYFKVLCFIIPKKIVYIKKIAATFQLSTRTFIDNNFT